MTDRSLFPDGVPVHDVDLQNESTKVSEQVRRRLMDHSQAGLVSGGVITRNGTTTSRIDVSSLVAYPTGGEMIELGAQTAVALADYTVGALNYVTAVYTETQATAQAHQTDGTTRNTRATRSARLVVMTSAQFSAMPATSTDLSVNAVDRACSLGIVLGNGFTGATPNAINLGDIIQDTAFSSFVAALYPAPSTLVGVNIASIDQSTAAGSGTLTFVAAGATLAWTAPSGTIGVAVAVGAGGQFTLTSGTIARTITVNVIPELLPIANTTASIVVNVVYTPSYGPRFSARDMAHRSAQGSLALTSQNPHGLAPRDWGTASVDIPGQLRFGEDYLGNDLAASYPRQSQRMRSGARTLFNQFQVNRTNNIWARVYATTISNGEFWITINARWNQATTQWVPDYNSANSFALVVGDGRSQMRYQSTAGAAFADSTWITSAEWSPGSYASQLGGGMLTGTSDTQRPRVDIDYLDSSENRTRILRSASSAASTTGGINIYRTTTCSQTGNYPLEIVANAEYLNATSLYHQMNAALSSVRFAVSPTGITAHAKAAGSADWGGQSWTPPMITVDTAGVVTAGTDFGYSAMPTHRKRVPGISARFITAAGVSAGWTGTGVTLNAGANGTSPASGLYTTCQASAGNNAGAVWPLELPHGAIITSVQLTFTSANLASGAGGRMMMYRQNYDSTTINTLLSTGVVTLGTGGAVSTASFTPDQNQTIDNTNAHYWLHVFVGQDASQPSVSVIDWLITYTMPLIRGA